MKKENTHYALQIVDKLRSEAQGVIDKFKADVANGEKSISHLLRWKSDEVFSASAKIDLTRAFHKSLNNEKCNDEVLPEIIQQEIDICLNEFMTGRDLNTSTNPFSNGEMLEIAKARGEMLEMLRNIQSDIKED